MKTFQQFQQDLHEFVPALAPLAPYVLPAAAAALGAAGMYFARKQGEGKRSQPVDYGQSGETTARTPNVQRPSAKTTAARTQAQVARDDRRAAARERAAANTQQKIDDLIGSDAERKAAAQARANQPQIQKGLRQADQRRRMEDAAKKLGLPEQMTAPKLQGVGLDLRTTKEKQQEIDIPAKLLPFNPKIGDQYKTSQLDPGKSYVPQDPNLMHIDTRTPGEKLRNLQQRRDYYGGYPPKAPKV